MKATTYRTTARALRRRGHSLSQLAEKFFISKSTASLWTKDVKLDQIGIDRIRKRSDKYRTIAHETLHQRKISRLIKADFEAQKLLDSIKKDRSMSLVALALMYWCEGSKDGKGVAFTNSDPELVKAFIRMLEEIFQINRGKLRICVHLHDYHDAKEVIFFWSTVTGLPINQFTNPYIKESKHTYAKQGYKGCARVTYYDSHISRVILSFAKKFIKLYI